MDSIHLMMEEHRHILTFVSILRTACCRVLEGDEIPVENFPSMVQFARCYADQHHHGKEEQILFREMSTHLGSAGTHLIQHGMLVEHNLGRMYLTRLEAALERYETHPSTRDKLEILTEAAAWANLLEDHIEKEDQVVYPFARRSLPAEVLHAMDCEVQHLEDTARTVRETALRQLDVLIKTYGQHD